MCLCVSIQRCCKLAGLNVGLEAAYYHIKTRSTHNILPVMINLKGCSLAYICMCTLELLHARLIMDWTTWFVWLVPSFVLLCFGCFSWINLYMFSPLPVNKKDQKTMVCLLVFSILCQLHLCKLAKAPAHFLASHWSTSWIIHLPLILFWCGICGVFLFTHSLHSLAVLQNLYACYSSSLYQPFNFIPAIFI